MDDFNGLSRTQLVDALTELHRQLVEAENRSDSARRELDWWSDATKRRTRELNERVKEIRCLYDMSHIMDERTRSLDDQLGRLIALLPPAWQFPDRTWATLRWNGRDFSAGAPRPGPWRLTQRVVVAGGIDGEIVVGFVPRGRQTSDPFLFEERALLAEFARRLGVMLSERTGTRTGSICPYCGRNGDSRRSLS
jgi:hypothetical protein